MTNYIPLGDHCIVAILLKELNSRSYSYPFDWTSNRNELFDSNININIDIFNMLMNGCSARDCAIKYIGTDLTKENKFYNNVFFPHEFENESYEEIVNKYTRRFERLYTHTKTLSNIFIIIVRCHLINIDIILKLNNILSQYNNKLVIISGTFQPELEELTKNKNIIYKHIYYDYSKYYSFDYSDFRPAVKDYLQLIVERN